MYGKLPFYAAMFADAGFPVSENGKLPDGLLDALVLAGSPDEVMARLDHVRQAGASEILAMLIPVDDRDAEETALMKAIAG